MEAASGAEWSGREDLVSEGLVGYSEALNRYRKNRGASPWTFALYRVKGRIVDAIRREIRKSPSGPRPAASTSEGHPEGPPPATASPRLRARSPDLHAGVPGFRPRRTVESAMTAREAAVVLGQLLRRLTFRQRHLVVECGLKRRPVYLVCHEVGLARGPAGRLLHPALNELGRELRDRGYRLDDFV